MAFAEDDGAVDGDCFDVAAGGDVEHDIEHHFLEDGAECAGAGATADGFLGEGAKGIAGDAEFDSVHGELFLVLFDERVFGLGEDVYQFVFGEFAEGRDDREAADEFGDEAEVEEVLGLDAFEDVDGG